MKNFLAKLSIFRPVAMFFGVSLLIFSIARIALGAWQWERMAAGTHYWRDLLLGGLRIDCSMLCWISLALATGTFLASFCVPATKIWNKILRVLIVILLSVFIFMELATPEFVETYDLRPNRLFVEYLTNPKEVFAMLFAGHFWSSLLTILLTAGTVAGTWFLTKWFFQEIPEHQEFPEIPENSRNSWCSRFSWRSFFADAFPRLIAMLIIVPACILFGRSSLGHRPINPAMVAFASDNLLNSFAMNSTYSVAFSISQMGNEKNAAKIYGDMREAEIFATIRAARERPESDYISAKFPTLTRNIASVPAGEKPRNIVIILQESFGARFVGSLGGEDLTPNFDALAREGWLFKNLYCTGTRSVRGIEAVITGFTPTPARSVVKLDNSQTDFWTIADCLRSRGYATEFIYGGESHFDNMATFFLGNGFQKIIDEDNFDRENLIAPWATWGASDEDLFAAADKEFSEKSAAGTPFFALVFTSSNHDPFDVPARPDLQYKSPGQTRENAVQYADYALGKFFARAKNSNYWDNTIFVVIADHDSRVSGANSMPIDRFHIPALIIAPGLIEPRADERLVSQIDVPPTILSLAGISADWPMIGYDLTKESPNRAMMQFDKIFAYMRKKGAGSREQGAALSEKNHGNGDNPVADESELHGNADFDCDCVLLNFTERAMLRYNLRTKEITELAGTPIDESLERTALATVLLGSRLYKNALFPSVEKIEADSRERETEAVPAQ